MAGRSWRFVWRGGPAWDDAGGTRLLGVVNATPDSFSDGGRFLDAAAAADQAERLVADGAGAIDVGAESTRPGHTALDPQTEWERLAPALQAVVARVRVPVSVDTRHAAVARRALDAGAAAVNDVSGLADPEMAGVIASAGASAIVGHWQPRLGPWQVAVVARALAAARAALVDAGVPPERVALDPGLGFGKQAEDNWRLLAGIDSMAPAGVALAVGASRKRFVTSLAATDELSARDQVTSLLTLWLAQRGVAMVRVHDAAASARALAVWQRLREAGAP